MLTTGFFLAALVSGCRLVMEIPDESPVRCGDGVRQEGEICDGADLGGASCAGMGHARGELLCLPDCSGYDESGCIWKPAPGTTWQWQLGDYPVDTTVAATVYDVDLFDVADLQLAQLRAAGRKIICYFSAGSWEEWRSDAGSFDASDIGNDLAGWPGEKWLDIRSPGVRAIMENRLDLAAIRGCDAVEPDNLDAYANDSGFSITLADQLDYNRFLASVAHARGLSVGLKGAVGLVSLLEPDFDWAHNEECHAYDECAMYTPFVAAGKAVFHVEYVDDESAGPARISALCSDPSLQGFSTIVKLRTLNAWRLACD